MPCLVGQRLQPSPELFVVFLDASELPEPVSRGLCFLCAKPQTVSCHVPEEAEEQQLLVDQFTHFVLVPPQSGQTLSRSVDCSHVRIERKSTFLFRVVHFVCLRFRLQHVFFGVSRRLTKKSTRSFKMTLAPPLPFEFLFVCFN